MTSWPVIGSGLTGALTLTAVHEAARRRLPEAPRMDVLGMRAIARATAALGQKPPPEPRLRELAPRLGAEVLPGRSQPRAPAGTKCDRTAANRCLAGDACL